MDHFQQKRVWKPNFRLFYQKISRKNEASDCFKNEYYKKLNVPHQASCPLWSHTSACRWVYYRKQRDERFYRLRCSMWPRTLQLQPSRTLVCLCPCTYLFVGENLHQEKIWWRINSIFYYFLILLLLFIHTWMNLLFPNISSRHTHLDELQVTSLGWKKF